MNRRSLRRLAALIIGVGGALVAIFLGLQEQRTGETPTAPVLDLGEATPAMLDTVAFRGRRIDASLSGRVIEVTPGGTLWVGSDTQAFPVRVPDAAEVDVEDRLLAVGRLRGRGGRRWLEARGWTHVQSVGRSRGSLARPTVQDSL